MGFHLFTGQPLLANIIIDELFHAYYIMNEDKRKSYLTTCSLKIVQLTVVHKLTTTKSCSN